MKQLSVSPEIRAALEAVLGYLQDEKQDFEEAGKPAQHIYHHVAVLHDWLGKGDCCRQGCVADSSSAQTGEFRMNKIAFPLGKLRATPQALKRIRFEDILTAINRHQEGDWNRIPRVTRERNDLFLKTGGLLVSGHFDARGRHFWVITNAARTETLIESAEGENPGND